MLSGSDGQARVRGSLRRRKALDWLVRSTRGDTPITTAGSTDEEEDASAAVPADNKQSVSEANRESSSAGPKDVESA